MNAATLSRRAIPEPFQILGLRLRPLSLGRYRLLTRFGCSFVNETEQAVPCAPRNMADLAADLILGVLICSMRCDDFLEFIQNPRRAHRQIRKWARRTGAQPPALFRIPVFGPILSATRLGRFWRDRHSFNLIEKAQLFRRYLTEHCESPNYVEESMPTRASSAHWTHAVETTLRARLGWSADEINEAPLSKALADYFKWAESEGMIRLLSGEELEQMRTNDAALAAAIEARKNSPLPQIPTPA